MRLTRYTDYALRVLMYLTARPDRYSAISAMSADFDVSHNHLMKVVHDLGRAGFVTSARGRNGGVRLARPASGITVGEVVRMTEDSFRLVECDTCRIAPGCGVSPVLAEAAGAFLAVLDGYALSDLPRRDVDFMDLFPRRDGGPGQPSPSVRAGK